MNRPAFTLLELLVAVTILAVLATLATAAMLPARLTAQRNAVRADFVRLAALCDQHKGRTGKYPQRLADVTDQFTDPWGNPYKYTPRMGERSSPLWRRPELRFLGVALESAGPDRRASTADDLCNWKE